MKYLKRFSETLDESSSNESHTDIIQNVKDILLPISDMGYEISVNHYINVDTNQLIIRVVTYADKPLSITDEVKEEFIRMKDYLNSEGYDSIEAQYYTRDEYNNSFSSGKYLKQFDDFIDAFNSVKKPIVNLLFIANKKL